jgi:hypothetical protein
MARNKSHLLNQLLAIRAARKKRRAGKKLVQTFT